MQEFIGWITANWADVLAIITGIITVASIIVKLTPTTKDDAALSWVMKVLEHSPLTRRSSPMWTTIAVLVGVLVVIGGAVLLTYKLAYQKGKSEVQRDIAEDEAERRAKDAEIAARPAGKRPLDSLFE